MVDAWPIGIGAPCFGCTEKSVGFRMPAFDRVDVHLATPPDTYAPISSSVGKFGAAAAGLVGIAAGAMGGATWAASQKLASSEEAIAEQAGSRRLPEVSSHGNDTPRGIQKSRQGQSADSSGRLRVHRLPEVAHAEEETMPKGALGLLYDATKCVGCKSCMVACSQANDLKPDTRTDGLHQAPPALNYFTKNIIKLYRTADGSDHSYFKQQCMHCVDPGCMTACMFGGLRKDKETGVVWWLGSKCVGCRYCEIACPFHIPAFQWDGFNPKIVKCELCRERLGKGLAAWLHRRLPHPGSDLRKPRRSA